MKMASTKNLQPFLIHGRTAFRKHKTGMKSPSHTPMTLECLITMPTGTPQEQTSKVAGYIETKARQLIKALDAKRAENALPRHEHTISLMGAEFGRHNSSSATGSHLAQIRVQLLESGERYMSSIAFYQMWRKAVGKIPDAEAIVFKGSIFYAEKV